MLAKAFNFEFPAILTLACKINLVPFLLILTITKCLTVMGLNKLNLNNDYFFSFSNAMSVQNTVDGIFSDCFFLSPVDCHVLLGKRVGWVSVAFCIA